MLSALFCEPSRAVLSTSTTTSAMMDSIVAGLGDGDHDELQLGKRAPKGPTSMQSLSTYKQSIIILVSDSAFKLERRKRKDL